MKLSRMLALASICSLTLAASYVFAAETETVSADAPAATCAAGGTCSAKGSCSESGTCSADKVAGAETCASEGACSACDMKTAMAKLPAMTFVVGEKETCCSESAAALAESADKPVQYKVGEAVFETKEEAFTTLVTKTEEMVEAFTHPSTCSVSGTTTIAGKSCQCPTEAGTLATKVSEATELVSMKYKVGEETCSCPMSAKAMAKKAGVEPTYVVGDTETHCEMTARLALAREKYKAALIALAPSTDDSSEG